MKKQVQDSLDKIKYLMEFHFKENSRADSVDTSIPNEQPVSFKEVGDTYKKEPEHDFPTWETYRDDVIMQEEDVDGNGEEQKPQTQQPPVASAPVPQAIPAGQENTQVAAPQTPPAPQAQQAAPAPVSQPTEEHPIDNSDHMFIKLEDQMAKTEEMLAKFDLIQQQLSSVQNVSLKLDDVERKLDELNNPPYDEQLEMISKNAYPYNVKLSDFWGWDKDENEEKTPESFKLTTDDINSYNKEEIKNSFK